MSDIERQHEDSASDSRPPQQQQQDAELADRLSSIIEDANRRVVPLVKQIRQVGPRLPFCPLLKSESSDKIYHLFNSTLRMNSLAKMTRRMKQGSSRRSAR
jgi:hypothetical protein